MDSQTTSRLNSLQRDLAELELRETNLKNDLAEVSGKIRYIKEQINLISRDDRLTGEILERVYEQRRIHSDPNKKRG